MNRIFSFIPRLLSGREGDLHNMRPMTPEIIGCNEFIRLFLDSNDDTVQVTEQTITAAPVGMLSPLHAIPYVKVRNRFRILSNLDPVINRQEETGTIRVGFNINSVSTEFCIITLFAPDGESFTLKKTAAPRPSRQASHPLSIPGAPQETLTPNPPSRQRAGG